MNFLSSKYRKSAVSGAVVLLVICGGAVALSTAKPGGAPSVDAEASSQAEAVVEAPQREQLRIDVGTPSKPKPAVSTERPEPLEVLAAPLAVDEADTDTGLQIFEYEVVEGDTLWGIATRYGTHPDTIAQLNHDLDLSTLFPGTRIVVVKNFAGHVYEVLPGDTISGIAAMFGVKPDEVLALNPAVTPEILQVGQLIFLPEHATPRERAVTLVSRYATGGADEYQPFVAEDREDERVPAQERATSYIWPLAGDITSRFGYREGGEFHTGIDIGAPSGTPIVAARAGRVLSAGWDGGYGKQVTLVHDDGSRTIYAHASDILVSKDQYVQQGEVIAYVGSTGRSTGPHLHFEIIINGAPQDPLNYLP